MRKYIFILLFVALLNVNIFPIIRHINFDAKTLGMGNTGITASEGISSIFYNPANTFLSDRKAQFVFTYNSIYNIDEIDDYACGLLYKYKDYTAVGLGWNRRSVESIYAENLIGLNISSEIFNNLFTGILIKYINYSASGYDDLNDPNFDSSVDIISFDIGITYKAFDFWKTGMTVYDINSPEVSFVSTTVEKDKQYLRFGFSNSVIIKKVLNISIDVLSDDEDFEDYIIRWGMELIFFDAFMVRTGMNHKKLNVGFGLKGSFWELNGALETNKKLGNHYRMSINLNY